MRRQWFRHGEGGFYRNCPLIMAEVERTPLWRWRTRKALLDEWDQAFHGSYPRIDALGPGDVVVEPMPMREAYPNQPIFWSLDEKSSRP